MTLPTKIRFDGTVQFGHVLQILVLGLGIIAAWGNMRTTIASHEKELITHEHDIQVLRDADISIRETQNRLSENLIRLTAIIEERTHRLTQ